MTNLSKKSSYKLAGTAILIAIIVVFQLLGGILKIGAVNLSVVLIPIVIGSVVFGKTVGAILGFSFGVITLVMGITGADYFTFVLFQNSPVITTLICLVKGTVAGFISGLSFELLKGKNEHVGVTVSAIVAPVVNTGLFLIGSIFLIDVLKANFVEGGTSVVYFLLVGCAGLNFLVELLINAVCAPALFRVYKAVRK